MQKLLICLVFFTCIYVSIWATNNVKGGPRSRYCRTNRQYHQLQSTSFSQNALCYKTIPYSHVLALNSSGSLYNIISQPPGDNQLSNNWVTIVDCCDGYKRNVTNNMCMPVCTYECPENAYCFLPEICACNLGYEEINGQCKLRSTPLCPNGCENGECVAPGVCRCRPETILILDDNTNKCIPLQNVCEEGCLYGLCSGSVCTSCMKYRNASNDGESCISYCEPDFEEDEEISLHPTSESCDCRPGFTRNEYNACVSYINPPQCQYPCGPNSQCIADNWCECDPGLNYCY